MVENLGRSHDKATAISASAAEVSDAAVVFVSTYAVAAATGAAVVLLLLPSRLCTRSTATGQRYAYWPHYTALLSQCGLAFTARMEGSMTLYKQATAMAGTKKRSTDQPPPAIQVQGKRSSQ